MVFLLVPKLLTLNDREREWLLFSVISPNLVALGASQLRHNG